MRGEGKLVFLIDNICISAAATIVTIWTWSAAKNRIDFSKYVYYEQREPPSWKSEARRDKYLYGIAYVVVLWLIRAAFLSMYFRVVPKQQRFLRKFLYFNTAYAAATFCANIGIQVLWCLPISSVFQSGEYACYVSMERQPIIILFISNITSDIGTSTVRFGFAINILDRAVILTQNLWSITYVLNYAAPVTEIFFGLNMDEQIQFWSEMEVFTAAVAVCLPSLRSFLQRRLSTQTLNQALMFSQTEDQDMEATPRTVAGGMLAQLEKEAKEYGRIETSTDPKGKKAGGPVAEGLLAQLEAEAKEYDRIAVSGEPPPSAQIVQAGGSVTAGLLAQLEREAKEYERIETSGEPEPRPPTPPPKDR
ncbi:hypothetical protein FPQ18DRAFT_414561 [Pyronema domesticum]|nr:hypothetical protein FPQ18DRAFT_414561 [Pyronema domesticum]